ncbi:GDSL esterase/lipase 1 isoform X2 [Jatropha curcas]|uniref:GDSL esterase/lipase 1 isoform X2 n=1 Tax=Jatropha curcas TaxID=180498 RepID=UPI0009D66EE9|nr:GDSL esterase/lipase 1 isoform X2 [Jatropha curcas]
MGNLKLGFSFLIFCSCLLISTSSAQSNNLPSQDHKNFPLFIFGDSIFDAGNNNYLKTAVARANFWPYGETFFKCPTGRASDGRLIPDFIAEYLKLPFIRPYLEPNNHHFTNGVNFASGGAGALVETFQGRVTYFKKVEKQLGQKLGNTETKALLARAIYLFNNGGNDYASSPSLINSSSVFNHSRKKYVAMVIGNLTTVIEEIYETGGRKFGVLSIGALGLLPVVRAIEENVSSGFSEQVTILAKLHNNALSNVLKKLQRRLQDFKYLYFDTYSFTICRINNPSKYGFKVAKAACCGSGPYRGLGTCGGIGNKEYELCTNPSEYLFFDGIHPTEKFNYQLAKLMWNGSHKLTRPYNLKTLVES